MKRIFNLFLLMMISLYPSSSENYEFEDQNYRYQVFFSDWPNPGYIFSLTENKLFMELPELDYDLHEEGYYIHSMMNEDYKIYENKGFTYLVTNEKKFLVLYFKNLVCALVDCDDYTTYFGLNEKSIYVDIPKNRNRTRDWWIGISEPDHYKTKTSSYLKENKIEYDGKNKYSWQIKNPWAEGITGSGIGEWIEKESIFKTNSILLLNGYVDPKHPDYFYKNERLKDIEIITEDGIYEYTLEDSPQLQILELPNYVSGKIKIKIKSVYPGTKYKDTCLSFFAFLVEKNKQN